MYAISVEVLYFRFFESSTFSTISINCSNVGFFVRKRNDFFYTNTCSVNGYFINCSCKEVKFGKLNNIKGTQFLHFPKKVCDADIQTSFDVIYSRDSSACETLGDVLFTRVVVVHYNVPENIPLKSIRF